MIPCARVLSVAGLLAVIHGFLLGEPVIPEGERDTFFRA